MESCHHPPFLTSHLFPEANSCLELSISLHSLPVSDLIASYLLPWILQLSSGSCPFIGFWTWIDTSFPIKNFPPRLCITWCYFTSFSNHFLEWKHVGIFCFCFLFSPLDKGSSQHCIGIVLITVIVTSLVTSRALGGFRTMDFLQLSLCLTSLTTQEWASFPLLPPRLVLTGHFTWT